MKTPVPIIKISKNHILNIVVRILFKLKHIDASRPAAETLWRKSVKNEEKFIQVILQLRRFTKEKKYR